MAKNDENIVVGRLTVNNNDSKILMKMNNIFIKCDDNICGLFDIIYYPPVPA